MQNSQKYTFHVDGMHCNACVLMTESEAVEVTGVSYAKSNLGSHTLEIRGAFGETAPERIAEMLNARLLGHGYKVSVDRLEKDKKWRDFRIAAPIALLFAVVFVVLQKVGLVNLINGDVGYTTAFVVGIIASLSSCMAVVGGLLLSMSATFAKEGDRVRPQLMFHGGRLASFFVLGGVIGVIGSAFTLNAWTTFSLSLVIAIVMLILGINLLDVFPWAKKLQPSMPRFLAKHAMGATKFNHTMTPLLVGVVTFFLPCGFTQSMQLYTLTTGSFLSGGLTMLVFALGTLPVLALISFSSFSIRKSGKSSVFFKTAGLIVIMFALLNLFASMAAIGIIPPLLNL